MLLRIIILLSVTTPHSHYYIFASPIPTYTSAANIEVTKTKTEIQKLKKTTLQRKRDLWYAFALPQFNNLTTSFLCGIK